MAKTNKGTTVIFEILEERGIPQRELAEVVGVSPGNVGDWKSGKAKPSFDVIVRIADYLDIPADVLLERDVDMIDETTAIRKSVKDKSKQAGSVIKAIPQRMNSLRSGTESMLEGKYTILKKYLRCSEPFLFGAKEYVPEADSGITENAEMLAAYTFIYDILDRCAADDVFKLVQEQLSQVFKYNYSRKKYKGKLISQKLLIDVCKLSLAKVNYIHGDKVGFFDKTECYGYNLSDFLKICEVFGLSPKFLISGVEK